MKLFKRAVNLFLIVTMFAVNTVGFAAITDVNGVNIPDWSIVFRDAEGYVELVNDSSRSGSNVLHLVKTTPKDGSAKFIKLNNTAPIDAGKTYAYGCWIKADKAMQINMFFTDNGMENMSALGHTWDWKKVEFKVEAVRSSAAQEVGFMCYGAARNVWIDDVFVYEVDKSGKYVGDNLITKNPGFEASTVAGAANAATQTDERVVVIDKNIETAEDYLSVSKNIPMFYSNEMKVDGKLSDWNNAMPVDFLRYYRMKNYTGDCTITATLKTAYDDKNFYFLVAVNDPVHCDTGLYYWSSDSLQFMLSTQEGVYGEEISLQHITDAKPFCTHTGIDYNTSRMGDVTYYEVAIPWGTYIPEKPGEFWFNAAINNNDGADRIYCHEIAEGITSAKSGEKAKKIVPMTDDEKTLAYLSSEQKNVMLPDEELKSKMVIVNLGDTQTVEVNLPSGSEKINIEANSFIEKEFGVTKHSFGNNTLTVDIKYPDKVTTVKYDYLAMPDDATVKNYCDAYTAEIAELRKKAEKLNKGNIPTDYEDIELNMAERSVEVLAKLQNQGDYDVVVYNINVLNKNLAEVETKLLAYESGEKKPTPIPKLADGKVVMKGNSFYGKTVTNGVEEYRPVYLSSMNMGWEDRNEYPVWGDFGFNTVPISISFADVVGQADTPTVWKKQRGTVAYADADITVSREEAKSGKHSVKFVNRTAAKDGYSTYLYQSLKPEANTKYILTFSAKGNLEGMKVGFGSTNALSGVYDEWKDYKFSWTAGATPAATNVVVLTSNITDGAYIDDLCLVKEGSDENLIVNGDFEDYYEKWENTIFGVNYAAIDDTCDILRRAEFYNLKIILGLVAYDPNAYLLTLENVKDAGKTYGAFMKTNPTAPMMEEALRIFYRAVIPKAIEYDSLAIVQTHNEPSFNTSDSTYYKPFYTQYLADKYKTIENLNKHYNSEYKTFEEIEMPKNKETNIYFYDWQTFNESVLTDYFKIVAEEMKSLAPNVTYSAKYMAETSPTIADNTLKWGIDYEKIEPYVNMSGNDAFAYLGNGTIQTKLAWYDLQHSLKGNVVGDWEDHIIIDHKIINLDPRQYNWLITSIWQGAIHYVGSDNVWLWGISDHMESGAFRNTTMQYRADCMSGIGKTMSDINRLSYEVDAFRNEAADVGLFYSHASRTLDVSHTSAFYESYLSTMYNGYKPCFITESHFDDINNYKVFVVPEALHTSRENVERVIDYANKGGKVILLGEDCFRYDLNNVKHSDELLKKLYSVSEVIPTGTLPGEKRTAIASQLFGLLGDRFDKVLNPKYSLIDTETGKKVEDTEWLAVEYNGSVIVNMLNYDWNSTKKLKLVSRDKVLTVGEDLLTGEQIGDFVSLAPYTPTFIKYNK